MSVLARKRKLAATEYVMNMIRIHNYTKQRMDRVPARLRKFIFPKVMKPITLAHYDTITGYQLWSQSNKSAPINYMKNLDDAIRALGKMQKPLMVYWNLFHTKPGGVKEWTDLINREIALLNGAIKREERELPMIHTYDLRYSENRQFVWEMQQLHRYFYPKLTHIPIEYKDHLVDEILYIIDNALFHVLEGNREIPRDAQQYRKRTEYFKRAIAELNSLQTPLLSLWIAMQYSENEMNKQAEMINSEIKLIKGVIKSDRSRFADLK